MLLALVTGGFVFMEVLRLVRELLASPPELPAPLSPTASDMPHRPAPGGLEEPVVQEDQQAVATPIDPVDEAAYSDTTPG